MQNIGRGKKGALKKGGEIPCRKLNGCLLMTHHRQKRRSSISLKKGVLKDRVKPSLSPDHDDLERRERSMEKKAC